MVASCFNVNRRQVVTQSGAAADVLIVRDKNARPVHYNESYHSQQIRQKYPEGNVLPFTAWLPEEYGGQQTHREKPPGIRIDIAVVIRVIHA